MNRRTFLAGGLVKGLAGCRRPKGAGFAGYAFVANEEGQAVAAVDLTAFAVARHIRIEGNPTAVIAHPTRPSVYALTPNNGLVHEIALDKLALRRTVRVAATAHSMRLDPDGSALWILCRAQRQLVRLPLERFNPEARIALPEEPLDFELSPQTPHAAVSFGARGSVAIVNRDEHRVARLARIGEAAGTLRFLKNGRQVLVANPLERVLSIFDTSTGRIVVHLPLAVRPDCLCFNADGGQLFITGEGMDAVVVVYPFQTQVAATTLAGHAPGFMAASTAPDYLFVANPQTGDVTVLDIRTLRLAAVVAVGSEPGHIAITPDNQYALVLNQKSGDMAVIRIATVAITQKRVRSAPLFTMIPVGSKPVSAAVRGV